MNILITVIIAVVLFVLAAVALSLKVLLGNRTPLKRHACEVMCENGRNHPCTCAGDGTCEDSGEPK